MAPFIAWLAVGIAVLSGEGPIIPTPGVYNSEADCAKSLVGAGGRAEAIDGMAAYGFACVPVTINAVAPKTGPKMSTPKPNALGDDGVREL